MRQKTISKKVPAEKVVRDTRRKTQRNHSPEKKVRILLEVLRSEGRTALLRRREGKTGGILRRPGAGDG